MNAEHKEIRVICPPGQIVSQYLIKQGISIRTNCGGRGNCAQCLVKVIRGNAPITDMMRIQLTKEQLDDGIRLACHLMTKEELEIEVL